MGRGRAGEHETQLDVGTSNLCCHHHHKLELVQILSNTLFVRFYLDDCKALVFVVDSSDPGRLPEAQKALKKVLSDERLRDVPLMLLANKNDLPNALSIEKVQYKVKPPV